MKSYSPYDNVEAKAYPNILITTGLHDSQVQYFEPAKWVAKMREMKTDKNIILFKTNMEAGHGGASGRFKGTGRCCAYLCFPVFIGRNNELNLLKPDYKSRQAGLFY
jgi:protease II